MTRRRLRVAIEGDWHRVRGMAARLVAKGHQVTVRTYHPLPWVWESAEALGVAVVGGYQRTLFPGPEVLLLTGNDGPEIVAYFEHVAPFAGDIVVADLTTLSRVDVLNHDARKQRPRNADEDGDLCAAEMLSRRAPSYRYVKAQGLGPWAQFDEAPASVPRDVFVCGDDAGAKQSVATLFDDLDLKTHDIGGLRAAVLLERVALLGGRADENTIQHPSVYDRAVLSVASKRFEPTQEVTAAVTYGATDPVHGGSGWAEFTLRVADVAVAFRCSDAANEDPWIALTQLIAAVAGDRLPCRVEVGGEQEPEWTLGARRTDRPDTLWISASNQRDRHVEALVDRRAFVEAMTPALKELHEAKWRRE